MGKIDASSVQESFVFSIVLAWLGSACCGNFRRPFFVFPHRQEIVFFEMDTLKSRLSNVERFAKLLVSCQNAGRQWQRALHLPLDDSADAGLDAALASFVRASRGPAF